MGGFGFMGGLYNRWGVKSSGGIVVYFLFLWFLVRRRFRVSFFDNLPCLCFAWLL